MDEVYGKSPALVVLGDVVADNALPVDERVFAHARVVEERLEENKE